MLRYLFGLLSLTVLLATLTGCNKSDWGTTPDELEGEPVEMGFRIEKGGQMVDAADEDILIRADFVQNDDGEGYQPYQAIEDQYTMKRWRSHFVSLRDADQTNQMVQRIELVIGGQPVELTQWQVDTDGSYFVFKITEGSAIGQATIRPRYEVTFYLDDRDNDFFQGSVTNWTEDEYNEWLPISGGEEYYIVARENNGDYPEQEEPNIFGIIRDLNGGNEKNVVRIHWYTVNPGALKNDISDDSIIPAFKLTNDGNIIEPARVVVPNDVTVIFRPRR